ncbi:MAG: TetR/AcrR family transcriptional regulator [Panacagrimonas sp.]
MQQRSLQLVESLVEAAGRVVAEEGLAAVTTIRVAERAGVSVGSLYQYFENKEALLGALVTRMNGELRRAVDAAAPQLVRADPQAMVRGLLQVAFDFFGGRDGLHTELLRNWHRLDIQQGLHRFEQHMLEMMRMYALAHLRELRLDPQPAQGFIVINSVVFTLLRYLSLPRPALFTREQLVEELSRMIAGTMVPAAGPSTGRGRGRKGPPRGRTPKR